MQIYIKICSRHSLSAQILVSQSNEKWTNSEKIKITRFLCLSLHLLTFSLHKMDSSIFPLQPKIIRSKNGSNEFIETQLCQRKKMVNIQNKTYFMFRIDKVVGWCKKWRTNDTKTSQTSFAILLARRKKNPNNLEIHTQDGFRDLRYGTKWFKLIIHGNE